MNHSGGIPDYLPEIRGFTATSHGVGQVLEKITDDGSDEIAANLKQALEQGLVSKETAMDLAQVLFDKFARDKIVVRDFHAANLCLVRTTDGQARKLVLIDGLGEPTLIKARTIFPILHKRWRAKALRRLNAECDSILSQPKA